MMTRFEYTASAPTVASPSHPSDAPLRLPNLPQEDLQVFWSVWEHYRSDMLTRFCLRWMDGNREEAEDALSSASLRACRYWPVYARDIMNIRAWLLRLLYNHCMNIRKAGRRQSRFTRPDETISIRKNSQQLSRDSLEEAILDHEMRAWLHQAITALPLRLQEPLWLYLQEELPPRDIARQLHLSPENVRKRLQQARAMLRTQLVHYAQQDTAATARQALPN